MPAGLAQRIPTFHQARPVAKRKQAMDYERRFGDGSLMSYSQIARDHVDSIARAINVSNAGPQSRGGRERATND